MKNFNNWLMMIINKSNHKSNINNKQIYNHIIAKYLKIKTTIQQQKFK